MIFTRWDHRAGWQQTCDLYISFRGTIGWTVPVPLTELNTPQPDYAAALSPDDRWLYYRAGDSTNASHLAPYSTQHAPALADKHERETAHEVLAVSRLGLGTWTA